ncbi:MAG TPA: hypothetical protein DCM45_07515 [Clostridiales bacterium]|nr:hypothetical protein [Clostridiales bacterium]
MFKSDMTKRDILRYTGDFSQLFGVRDIILNNGSAKGMRALEINNGAGLSLTVLADRALDIASLAWRGDNLSYTSRAGLVAPQYYQAEGSNFLRSFTAGFLTTCGLRNVGPACEDQGESFGLHGRIAHVPAEDVRAGVVWHDDRPFIEIAGQVREARLFGEHLVLSRKITIPCGENRLMIDDTVENLAFQVKRCNCFITSIWVIRCWMSLPNSGCLSARRCPVMRQLNLAWLPAVGFSHRLPGLRNRPFTMIWLSLVRIKRLPHWSIRRSTSVWPSDLTKLS